MQITEETLRTTKSIHPRCDARPPSRTTNIFGEHKTMTDFNPLNPELYNALRRNFGQVKIDNPGQKMVRQITPGMPQPEIKVRGETYRVCCPWCGDGKFKLYVNYTFGTDDPETGQTFCLNKCFRCGPKTDQLKEMTTWTSIRRTTAILGDPDEVAEIPTYISPGLCVGLDDPRAEDGRNYLAGRGIDPLEATRVYGVSMCIEGNPLVCKGGMLGRLIFPVTKDGLHVGWQARLAFEPQSLDKDRSFKFLRWYTMPGVWRQDYLLGHDQANTSEHAILVEGPTDLVKQGAPCIASLGQTLSFGQARMIREHWDRVVIVGDHQKKADGTENEVQAATTKLLMAQDFKSIHLIKLPHGDPGDWDRGEFGKYVAEHIRQPRGQSMERGIAAGPHGLQGKRQVIVEVNKPEPDNRNTGVER